MENAEEFIKRKQTDIATGNVKPKAKDIGRKGSFEYITEAATYMKQSNLPQKVFVLERLRITKLKGKLAYKNLNVGEKEYRIGYYIVGKNGHMNGKWTWGQFCPLIPVSDFYKLIKKAEKEGTLLKHL